MSKNFAIAFGIGILCIAIAIGAVFYMQRGAHMELPGKILKVRTAPLDENSSAVVLDFRVTNPSDVLFVARNVTVFLEDTAGNQYAGQTASDVDAKHLMEGIPLLGQKFNDTLIIKQRIEPHTSIDRMVAARFEAPEAKLEARKRFLVQVEEIDGKIFQVAEK